MNQNIGDPCVADRNCKSPGGEDSFTVNVQWQQYSGTRCAFKVAPFKNVPRFNGMGNQAIQDAIRGNYVIEHPTKPGVLCTPICRKDRRCQQDPFWADTTWIYFSFGENSGDPTDFDAPDGTGNLKFIKLNAKCEGGTCTDKRKKCNSLTQVCTGGKEKMPDDTVCTDTSCSNCCAFPHPKWAWRFDSGGPDPAKAESGSGYGYPAGASRRAGQINGYSFGGKLYNIKPKKGMNVGLAKQYWSGSWVQGTGTRWDNPYVFRISQNNDYSSPKSSPPRVTYHSESVKPFIDENKNFYDKASDLPSSGKTWWLCTTNSVGTGKQYSKVEDCWEAFKKAKNEPPGPKVKVWGVGYKGIWVRGTEGTGKTTDKNVTKDVRELVKGKNLVRNGTVYAKGNAQKDVILEWGGGNKRVNDDWTKIRFNSHGADSGSNINTADLPATFQLVAPVKPKIKVLFAEGYSGGNGEIYVVDAATGKPWTVPNMVKGKKIGPAAWSDVKYHRSCERTLMTCGNIENGNYSIGRGIGSITATRIKLQNNAHSGFERNKTYEVVETPPKRNTTGLPTCTSLGGCSRYPNESNGIPREPQMCRYSSGSCFTRYSSGSCASRATKCFDESA